MRSDILAPPIAFRLVHHLGFSTVYLLGCDFRMDAERTYAFDEYHANAAPQRTRTPSVLNRGMGNCVDRVDRREPGRRDRDRATARDAAHRTIDALAGTGLAARE